MWPFGRKKKLERGPIEDVLAEPKEDVFAWIDFQLASNPLIDPNAPRYQVAFELIGESDRAKDFIRRTIQTEGTEGKTPYEVLTSLASDMHQHALDLVSQFPGNVFSISQQHDSWLTMLAAGRSDMSIKQLNSLRQNIAECQQVYGDAIAGLQAVGTVALSG